jgi:hypothetical protein
LVSGNLVKDWEILTGSPEAPNKLQCLRNINLKIPKVSNFSDIYINRLSNPRKNEDDAVNRGHKGNQMLLFFYRETSVDSL